jgi:hypothetical protein
VVEDNSNHFDFDYGYGCFYGWLTLNAAAINFRAAAKNVREDDKIWNFLKIVI